MSSGPCVKQTVTATLVAADGRRFVATNHCENPQAVCPRAGMKTGEGYHLCREVCRQPAHAEVNVLALAGEAARGGTLYLEGHTYACRPCMDACLRAGAVLLIGKPPERTCRLARMPVVSDGNGDLVEKWQRNAPEVYTGPTDDAIYEGQMRHRVKP